MNLSVVIEKMSELDFPHCQACGKALNKHTNLNGTCISYTTGFSDGIRLLCDCGVMNLVEIKPVLRTNVRALNYKRTESKQMDLVSVELERITDAF